MSIIFKLCKSIFYEILTTLGYDLILTTCGVCLEDNIIMPIVFPCGHSCCKLCFKKLLAPKEEQIKILRNVLEKSLFDTNMTLSKTSNKLSQEQNKTNNLERILFDLNEIVLQKNSALHELTCKMFYDKDQFKKFKNMAEYNNTFLKNTIKKLTDENNKLKTQNNSLHLHNDKFINYYLTFKNKCQIINEQTIFICSILFFIFLLNKDILFVCCASCFIFPLVYLIH